MPSPSFKWAVAEVGKAFANFAFARYSDPVVPLLELADTVSAPEALLQ